MSKNLITSRRFAPLFWTQFLSAFNDNFLKNTLVFFILFELGSQGSASLIAAAGAVFIAPFLLLSGLGGQIADRFDKARVAERLKLAEIGGAVLAVAGMALSSLPILFAALVWFGTVSALFGPIKYSILPDHLKSAQLPAANAWIESGTFIAILGGTIAGGVAFQFGGSTMVFGTLMIALAIGCWLISRWIPGTGSAAPDLVVEKNIVRSTGRLIGELRRDRKLWKVALMVSWFWLMGALFLSVLPVIVKDMLGGHEGAVTLYLAVFAVAIAIGSALAAWLSAGRINLLPAPVGTLLMAAFSLDLAFVLYGAAPAATAGSIGEFLAMDNTIRAGIDLAGLAIAGSLLAVPSFTALQKWADRKNRARVVAANNALNAGFMVAGGATLAGVQAIGVSVPVILIGLAVLNAGAAWWMLKALPTNAMRDAVSLYFRVFHRLEIEGLENVEAAGPAPIIALNHVSFLDGPLAATLTEREPTFAVDREMAGRAYIKPFLKHCNALPINPANPMTARTLIKTVDDGNPLVIFPEGRITVTGGLMKVYDGTAMVADKTNAPILPARIEGLERSFFSRLGEPHVRRSLFPKIKVTILPPQKLEVDASLTGAARRTAAGQALYRLMSDLLFRTGMDENRSIVERLIDTAKERGMSAPAVEDPITGKLSYGKMLTGVAVLARKFERLLSEQHHVGVMLPNSNGAAVTLFGLISAGKVPAMINFTAGAANILSACRTGGIKTVLSSRAFVEQAQLESVIEAVEKEVDIVWMDDLRETIGMVDKLRGLLTRSKVRSRPGIDEPAAILFTSGSEGTPKGVVLSHRNILANATQASARVDFHPGDKVFNVLPVFHSFGLTAGTVLPLVSGVPVYFYPSPLHYKEIPELIYGSNATIIFGTDTFLSGYARTAHAYDFRSIRYCFAGAEPVRDTTRATYMERFGLRILEGYGVTEAAPVIALNTPMHNRAGTVGQLMPGMEARLEPVPGVDEGGRLFVRGPNIMAGYLLAEEPGVLKPPADGWHDTGDIVTMDGDGYIAIKGRAKRFAKIGGEMVSLAAVEALASVVWPEHQSAVATVKDPRKGERLVLITDNPDATRSDFLAHAKKTGQQDLMVPSEVRNVESVPLLGSGKVDFVGVARLVEEGPAMSKAA